MGCFKSKSYQPFIKNSTEPDFFLVDIPEISDITESPVEIFVTANVSDPPAQPPLLDCPENTETPESDIDLSHGNGQMIPYQEQGGNEPVIPTSEWRIQGTETPPDRVQPRSPLSLESYTLGKVLGEGFFGKVFLAEHKETKEVCAMKAMKKKRILERDDIESIFKERRILQTVSHANHPFLVDLYGTFQSKSHIFFAMECLPGGDLCSLLKNQGVCEEPEAKFYAACVVLGLEALHQNGVIHRDLKLDNLLVDRKGYLKIVDFGLSKDRFGYGNRTYSRCGTTVYMAPEFFAADDEPYGMAVDWWALGVVIYVLLMYKFPFDDENDGAVTQSILYDEPEYTDELSKDANDFMMNLLKKDPVCRLGSGEADAQAVKRHVFFRFPFDDENDGAVTQSILYDEPEYTDELSKDANDFMMNLLKKDPVCRLGSGEADAQAVKRHVFFRDIDWQKFLERTIVPPFVPDMQGHLESFMNPKCQGRALNTSARRITPAQQEAFVGFDYSPD
eukprot:XP_017952741.1 PREDICTED: serine/threonine-protein kinase N2-like [Xenopus tropicalis]